MTMYDHIQNGAWTERWITLFSTILSVTVFIVVKGFGLYLQNKMLNKHIFLIGFISRTMFGIYLLEDILRGITKPIYNLLYEK